MEARKIRSERTGERRAYGNGDRELYVDSLVLVRGAFGDAQAAHGWLAREEILARK